MAEPEATTAEEWRRIEGFPTYLVSSLGRVWSAYRGGRFLVDHVTVKGYSQVELGGGRARAIRSVHRLVLEAFRGSDERQANHIDGRKSDNSLGNLEYATATENMKHAYRLGLKRTISGDAHYARTRPEALARGERHGGAKLTEPAVREIRRLRLEGLGHAEIARRFGISDATSCAVTTRRLWPHIA